MIDFHVIPANRWTTGSWNQPAGCYTRGRGAPQIGAVPARASVRIIESG